ncbi:cation:proton antiporter [Agrilactobacillus fermenti]|uniref:cation:proton antiporter n=1 Tax=Agrilactobacillus fermenti TaxID=2586909 RepID=UPI001E3E9E54|nr:cation:proton antiporter [Agrilactobacillus fermenti]MCD2255865.1 cation:proton antiporter [Agrilactobacillus fermenti]
MAYIGIIILILTTTTLLAQLAQRINVPSVIGQLLAGILLGPAVLNLIQPTNLIQTFAEIGVIILMFVAGLESDLQQLFKFLKPALSVAIIGVIFPVVLMGLANHFFGFTAKESLLVGVVFSATSVSISVDVLKEYKALNTNEGATILGAAVADDIIGVLLLSMTIAIMGGAGKNADQPLWFILLLSLAFFVGVVCLVRYLAPLLMTLSLRMSVNSAPIITALIICLGTAFLAQIVGLSDVIGAFFAGVAVAQTDAKKEIDAKIEPIGYGLFIPFFFVSIGLNMQLDLTWKTGLYIILLTILAILTKLYGCGLGAHLTGFDHNSSLMIGAGMISRGEMALITAQIGQQAHLIPEAYYSALIIVILLTTLISPMVIKHYLNLKECDKRRLTTEH